MPGGIRYDQERTWTAAAGIGTDKTSTAFGIKTDYNQHTTVTGLQLEPNQIEFGGNGIVTCDTVKGGWLTPRGSPYLSSQNVGREWFAVLHNSLTGYWDQEIKYERILQIEMTCLLDDFFHRSPFLRELALVGRRMGFTLDMCSESHMIAYDTAETLGEKLNKTLDAVGSHTVKFALIVMPKRDAKTYRRFISNSAYACKFYNISRVAEIVKKWGDVNKGISTQCLLHTTIRKSINRQTGRVNADTIMNLLLKMNVKMGGANWHFLQSGFAAMCSLTLVFAI